MSDTKITTMKKRNVLLLSGIMLALLAVGFIIWGYLTVPSNYISLDVNPSIEIQTNRLGQVVSIKPVNEDAKQVMAGYQLTDKNLEVVIKNIVDRMILNGYLAPDKDNQVLISMENNADAELKKNLDAVISAYLEEKQLNATLLHQNVELDINAIKAAQENNISAGKMELISELVQGDPTLSIEELSTERISDLIEFLETIDIRRDDLSKGNSVNEEDSDDMDEDVDVDQEDSDDADEDVDDDREDSDDADENDSDDQDDSDDADEDDADDE